MRCLIDGRVLLDPFPGGVTRVAQGLIEAMVALNNQDVLTIATTGMKAKQNKKQPGWKHVSIPNTLVALGTWTNLTSFDRLIPDTFDTLFLPNLEMVGQPRVPYALLVHDLSFLIEPRWFPWKTRIWHSVVRAETLIRGADALLAISEQTKQDLTRLLNISPDKIQTIPVGLSAASLQDSSNHPQKPYFLLLGGDDPRKNVGCILVAIRELQKTIPVELIVVSRASRPNDAALQHLLCNAAGLLYPSWYEGFGLPLHEAARYGTPVLAGTAGALPETAPKGTMIIPPFKPHLWVQAMRLLLTQPMRTSSSLAYDWSEAAHITLACLRKIARTNSVD